MDVCPRVAVLSDGESLTRFQPGEGRDILDIVFHAQIGDVVATCTYSKLKDDQRQVAVQLAPVFILSRGAANPDGQVAFSYFVGVVRDGVILNKQAFDITTAFVGNRSRMVLPDDAPPIVVDVPLPYKGAEYEYQILVSFQLTQAELNYNQNAPSDAD